MLWTALLLNVVDGAYVPAPAETPSAGAPAAAKRAASSAGSSSFADIFSRPMEESSDEEEEGPVAAALETDLEKYLKLPELPLTMADGKPCVGPGVGVCPCRHSYGTDTLECLSP